MPGGALDTRGRIDKMRKVRATALMNIPTYGLHLAEEAAKMGTDSRPQGGWHKKDALCVIVL